MRKRGKNKEKILQGIRYRAWLREKRKSSKYLNPIRQSYSPQSSFLNIVNRPAIDAPKDFRLIENTQECLTFFRDVRDTTNVNYTRGLSFIKISLANTIYIDYGAISVLSAISDDLKYQNITLQGVFPENAQCKQFVVESGFLNYMVDENNRPFKKAEKSELVFFEKGQMSLNQEDRKRISDIIKNVSYHLTGERKNMPSIYSILLEICGNSLEWSDTQNKQWLLGIKYEDSKVIFTITDVGKGILQTLHRKWDKKLVDFFNKTDDEILKGAFEKKYGSQTQMINRNKGLPSIKTNFDEGRIEKLKVLTNNVLLHFDNENLSTTFKRGETRFKGTYYQWEINNNCIK